MYLIENLSTTETMTASYEKKRCTLSLRIYLTENLSGWEITSASHNKTSCVISIVTYLMKLKESQSYVGSNTSQSLHEFPVANGSERKV